MKNRKHNRMKGFDYSSNNLYFVTCCVKNRECCLGDIVVVGTGRDLSVQDLSVQDLSVQDLSAHDLSAHDLPAHDLPIHNDIPPSEMILNEHGKIVNNQLLWLEQQYPYVVLHNHIVMPNHIHAVIEIDSSNLVGTGRDLSLRDLSVRDLSVQSEIKIKSLSQLMGAFKTTSSKLIHLAGHPLFEWQRSFHDHIIRDGKSYINIMNYITTNPERWKADSIDFPSSSY